MTKLDRIMNIFDKILKQLDKYMDKLKFEEGMLGQVSDNIGANTLEQERTEEAIRKIKKVAL